MSKIPELVHGISKRHYGNMNFARGDSGQVIENREHFLADLDISIEELIVPEMVHGSKISSVSLSDAGMGAKNFSDAIKGADGLVTRESNLFLMVTLADCLPILAYDPIAKVVGKGKITIPQDVRDVLGIKDGDYVGVIVWKIDVTAPEGA